MIEIERAEATEFGEGNQQWETFLVVGSYKEASYQLTNLINNNDAIGDFFRVVETATPPEPQHGREPEKAKKIKPHPNKAKRQDCANCLYPERSCSECINQTNLNLVEPEKVKPLAQYLAECIEQEADLGNLAIVQSFIGFELRELLEQVLDAYQSTENVVIRIEPV